MTSQSPLLLRRGVNKDNFITETDTTQTDTSHDAWYANEPSTFDKCVNTANRRPVLPVAFLLAIGLLLTPFPQLFCAVGVGLVGIAFVVFRKAVKQLIFDERRTRWLNFPFEVDRPGM